MQGKEGKGRRVKGKGKKREIKKEVKKWVERKGMKVMKLEMETRKKEFNRSGKK